MVCRPRNRMALGYLGYYLNSNAYHHQLLPLMQGIKVLSLSRSNIQKTSVSYPTAVKEQQHIAYYFSQLDNLITLHQRKCALLFSPFQALISMMFTTSTFSWEQRKLGELVDVCSGRDYKHLSEGTIPVYGTGGYMLSVNDALSYDRDAIGIGRKGTIDRPYILKAPFWTVDTLFYAIPREKVDLNYAFDIFQNIDWKKKDESTGVPSLSKTAINDIDVLAPKHDEQQIIGQFFAAIDNLITLHQRKFEKLTNVKKSMLEKMFPQNGSSYPEIRFKGFTDPWEQRKFEEIAVRSSVICSDDTLPRVEYEDIVSGAGRLNKDIYAKQSSKSGIAFHQGDVLYGKLRPYLQNWLLPTFDGLAVGDFWVLQPQNADSSFLYRLIQSRQFDEVANQSTGTKMPRADWKLVSKTVFSIPSNISEQAAIGTYFTALDSLITLHQRELEKLQNIKKSMLEKMFV